MKKIEFIIKLIFIGLRILISNNTYINILYILELIIIFIASRRYLMPMHNKSNRDK